jgi:hypothetical protein
LAQQRHIHAEKGAQGVSEPNAVENFHRNFTSSKQTCLTEDQPRPEPDGSHAAGKSLRLDGQMSLANDTRPSDWVTAA